MMAASLVSSLFQWVCCNSELNPIQQSKMKFSAAIAASLVGSAAAFAPVGTGSRLATSLNNDLWGSPSDGDKEMSKALPFVPRPKLLDGTMAGDVGFDPFGLAGADKASLLYMREAEIKHCRLAMLAVVGWPLAELFDKPIANAIGQPSALTSSGASPSVLNGGLDRIDIEYWVAVVALAGFVELENMKQIDAKGNAYVQGDCGFDPLGFFPTDKKGQQEMQTKELKHGRLAMMAILGFVVQEALYRTPVIQQTPVFFKPLL